MSAWLRPQALARPSPMAGLREALTVPFARFDPVPQPVADDLPDDDPPVSPPIPSGDDTHPAIAVVVAELGALRHDLQRVGWLVLVTAMGVALLHSLPALRWLFGSP